MGSRQRERRLRELGPGAREIRDGLARGGREAGRAEGERQGARRWSREEEAGREHVGEGGDKVERQGRTTAGYFFSQAQSGAARRFFSIF
jgi:hypothetical protein